MLLAVPNVSVGRDEAALARVVAAVRRASGPHSALLDVHTDADHNRTVLTLAGEPAALERLLAELARAVVRFVDIGAHDGVHPRVGALDVLPVVPWHGHTMDDARATAAKVGGFLGTSLGVPVFHYWELAAGERRRLVTYRRHAGHLAEAMRGPIPPDGGPPAPHPTAGASCVGARPLMVAYNVAVLGDDVAARRVAAGLRERNGGLRGVESLMFRLERRRCLQISCNLRHPFEVGPRDVYAAIVDAADDEDLRVGAAEVVGLAPRDALPERSIEAGLARSPTTLEDAIARAGLPNAGDEGPKAPTPRPRPSDR